MLAAGQVLPSPSPVCICRSPSTPGTQTADGAVALWAPGGQTMPERGPQGSAPTCTPGSLQPSMESKLKDFYQLQQTPSHLD